MAFQTQEALFKRKFPRRAFQRAAGLLLNGEYQVGSGVEIGEGGMSVRLPMELPVGREGVISFQLPEGSFVCVRMEVRSNQPDPSSGDFVVGCLFKNIQFEQKREIRSYVSARTEVDG